MNARNIKPKTTAGLGPSATYNAPFLWEFYFENIKGLH